MFAIIIKTSTFISKGERIGMYVQKYEFTELGWKVWYTKQKASAKIYKSYARAYDAARKIGLSFEIINL